MKFLCLFRNELPAIEIAIIAMAIGTEISMMIRSSLGSSASILNVVGSKMDTRIAVVMFRMVVVVSTIVAAYIRLLSIILSEKTKQKLSKYFKVLDCVRGRW